jgi:mannose-1-phosphate guanylyltransferase/mannose-6-phosphate isomerase
MHEIVPVVLCGGAGTRLWPVSRESLPKQFALLFDRSTFQDALCRVQDDRLFAPPLVVTSESYRFLVREQMRSQGAGGAILLEPCRRDSGAAIAAAAAFVGQEDSEALLLVLPADHRIEDAGAFAEAVKVGAEAARAGAVVTFGIEPAAATMDYGYIRPGEQTANSGVFRVHAFVEKPDLATAKRYLDEGYLWNSGIFLARADVLMGELDRFEPEIAKAAARAVANATRDLDFIRLDPEAFASAPAKSIDYAVMEKTARAATVPVSFPWSDLGSWQAVWALSAKDEKGNAHQGPASFLESSSCYAWSDQAEVVLAGVQGLAVIATPDAILVTPRGSTQLVKRAVERLEGEGKAIAVRHARDFRPWGNYQCIDRGGRYQVKRIVVEPGRQLSLQMHHHRSEHWVVVRGAARVTIGEEVRLVRENESVFIPQGAKHRLANPGKIPLELIEVQTGSYLGEDDIVRFEDDFGRD